MVCQAGGGDPDMAIAGVPPARGHLEAMDMNPLAGERSATGQLAPLVHELDPIGFTRLWEYVRIVMS